MTTTSREQILKYITDYNEFDVWECIGKCESDGDIDGIVNELQDYKNKNSNALIELINTRFEDLVFLSKTLSEIKEVTNEIKYPMKVLEKQTSDKIKLIKLEIEEVVNELTQKQVYEEQMEKQKIEMQIMNCYKRLKNNLIQPKSVEQVETACYQLEMLKYLIHCHNEAECAEKISRSFTDIENTIHTLLENFLLEYATTNDQEKIEICSNCYHLLGEMDLSQNIQTK
ncbi:hypothetical protein ENUP19_0328G0034 [Entamoeba nuttalli]|uniref:Conserved oligomeric Golgi complex subunit 2 n=1 Tax=Entamoeba nuttalli TaxID=412467 RepID=A0ABQ0DWM1_9EUKA